MTHKELIEQYMQGFREGNHPKILACLTDDVAWYMPAILNFRASKLSTRNSERCF